MTLQQLRDSLTSVPFNALLGMRLHRVHRDGITIYCTLRNDLRNRAGVAHGGVAAAMAAQLWVAPSSATSVGAV